MKRDLQQYAEDQLLESVTDAISGFVDIDEAISTIEDIEADFDGDSYCPYHNQQVDVIDAYEREFGDEAEEYLGEQTYKAADWQQAQTAYAYAIAYAGFSQYFSAAKGELIEALREFESDAQSELETDEPIRIQLTRECLHGWAAHNRELSDGTMIWETRQLDGSNGVARLINGIWISTCIDPAKDGE